MGADVVGVGRQGIAAKMFAEHIFAAGIAFFLGHVSKLLGVKGLLRTVHNERRCILVELAGTCPEPALAGVFYGEGEGIVACLPGPKPDNLTGAQVDLGFERLCKGHAGACDQTPGSGNSYSRKDYFGL
jgi:hypothetical protein